MKRRILILCLIAALLSVLSAGSLAYRQTYAIAENVITAGNVRAALHSKTADGTDAPEGVLCMPGSSHSQIVTVENVGSQPFFLRMEIKKYVKDSQLSAEGCILLDLNTQDWISQDGYYYYKEALPPGETTQPLFTRVDIDGKQVDNDYLGKTLMLDVSVQAVQCHNNSATALEAAGWPAS